VDKRGEAWSWLEGPMRGVVKEVQLLPNPHPHDSPRYNVPVSAEGVFSIPIMGKPDAEQYLLFTHNCTDTGEFIDERFNLSLFSERQPLLRYSALSQGQVSYPVSSHDTALTRSLTERIAMDNLHSWWFGRNGVPKVMVVEGGVWGLFSDQPGIKVVGRLYNWDYDTKPMESEEFFNGSRKVPLYFDGRVEVHVRENVTCKGAKLAIYRGGKEIMSGSTHLSDGPVWMFTEDGGLLETMEPLSDWILTVEHSCNRDSAPYTKKFRLTSSKRVATADGYFRMAGLEQAN